MPTLDETLTWRGSTLVDRDGDKIGSIDEIYEDTDTGQPEWALVHTGLFGTKRTFVPLREAAKEGDSVRVPYEKAVVKDAPGVDPDGALSHEEEQTLYNHYGLDWGTSQSGSGLPEGGTGGRFERDADAGYDRDVDVSAGAGTAGYETTGRGAVGHDVSGPTTDEAMTRSEEEVAVGKAQREAGRARLRKYVVTENVQTTVPVQREEVRLEREAITDANVGSAMDGPAISEEEHEVILHEEEPVVEKRVVPKERVRLDTETVTEERQVSEDVRKEQIEMEGGERTVGGDLRDERL